ncbi:protein I'm not dead yet [Drosophila eugracilis]|uniref:protein I'm not dead yet n=1 Tax=Drosophila eugracilis TaxID=29029 RepID=UPI0007E896F9|nr:protein I'm not dead yet [Drosophila eugracilis]
MAATQDYKPGDIPLEEQDDRRLFCKYHYKGVLIVVIPILLGPMFLGHPIMIYRFMYISLCLLLYYILNLMARGAVAFIYITFIPVLGIAGSKHVSISYYTDLIFLVYGSVMLGIMMDSSRLSERLAMRVIAFVGSSLKLLQIFLAISVIIMTALINPTIAAAIWMKVAQAVITEYDNAGVVKMNSEEKRYEVGSKPYPTRPVIGIYITCCYSATLAGCLSPFVNPNGVISSSFEGDLPIGKLLMIMAGPAILGIVVMIFWIQVLFLGLFGGSVKRDLAELDGNQNNFKATIAERKLALGPWTIYPILALILIIIACFLAATRKPIIYMGWDDLDNSIESGLSVPSIGMAILFFAIPANYYFCKYYVCRQPVKEGTANSLVSWKAVNNNTPWGEIFMLGAGFAAAFCSQASGLNAYVADSMKEHTGEGSGTFKFISGALYGTLLTMLSPATAVCRLSLPTLMKGGSTFSLPLATALHNQFLLPISTPSNTIIAGWGNIRPFQFMLAGSVIAIFMLIAIAGMTAIISFS